VAKRTAPKKKLRTPVGKREEKRKIEKEREKGSERTGSSGMKDPSQNRKRHRVENEYLKTKIHHALQYLCEKHCLSRWD